MHALLAAFSMTGLLLTATPSSTDGVAAVVSEAAAGGYRVEGRFRVEASVETVWQVLTDYEGIRRFAPDVEASRVQSREGGHVRVFQEAVVRKLLFTKRMRVLLDVEEDPPRAIHFEDVFRRDFDRYVGDWQLREVDGGVEVRYRLEAEQSFAVPGALASHLLADNARKLLGEVRAEILRVSQPVPRAAAR